MSVMAVIDFNTRTIHYIYMFFKPCKKEELTCAGKIKKEHCITLSHIKALKKMVSKRKGCNFLEQEKADVLLLKREST